MVFNTIIQFATAFLANPANKKDIRPKMEARAKGGIRGFVSDALLAPMRNNVIIGQPSRAPISYLVQAFCRIFLQISGF